MTTAKFLSLLLLLWTTSCFAIAQEICQGPWSSRTVELSLYSKRNQTGHWVTTFALGNTSPKLPRTWNARLSHTVACGEGKEKFQVFGTLTVPPSLPRDYQLFPGVGYYKFHTEKLLAFDDAKAVCEEEGGHLAIINSEEEHKVIRSFVKQQSAYLGFHDRAKEGEFVTIFGEPLSSTGFIKWNPGQPDNARGVEHCGTYHPSGGFNDVICDTKFPYICEFDLSWADN